ncbi:RNA polymerase sigma factor [Baekduia soli]|nr:sigma-70 family RNA polymerase sigma factor [Baekduia soli]
MATVAERPLNGAPPAEARRGAGPSRAERRLAAQLRAGDARALEAVHAQYGATVFGYLQHTLRDRAAAEDVFQQVLTEVWRRGAQYDPSRASVVTWILTIARSRAIDELRRRRPEPLAPDELPDGRLDAPQDLVLDRWRMSHLLAQLPLEERRLLELRFYGELSQSEIAERTGLAMGTIKSRMVRGLERLRALMDAEAQR